MAEPKVHQTTDEAPEEIWTAGPGRWLPDPTNGNHYVRADKLRAMGQALTWCVVNHSETLGDHPKLLERFREILGMEGEADD